MLEKDFDIKNLTTFKTGGKIGEVFFPQNLAEIKNILLNEKDKIQVFGNLSNTIVSTDGYDGKIVITTKMDKIQINGTKVTVDAGVKGPKIAQVVQKEGLSGFEFMIGFPGSVGGNVYMNASANGQCISDKFIKAECWSKEKGFFTLQKDEMKFGYRSSVCQLDNIIVLNAEFELDKRNPAIIQKQMEENLAFRRAHQPSLSLPNCGSVFKNPEGNSAGRLLDEVGAKTFISGGARVWENHANFIINYNNGTSEDILNLMYKMYTEVKEKFEIELRPEVKYLGNKNTREVELCKILNIK